MTTLRPRARHEFDEELRRLRDQIERMGTKALEALDSCARALVNVEPSTALGIIERDREIDAFELAIDHQTMTILALRQPVASDLRLVSSALKVVTDLGRIGDLAVNIAERLIELGPPPASSADGPLMAMLGEARGMLALAVAAFVRDDPGGAREVLDDEQLLDLDFRRLVDALAAQAREQPESLSRLTRVQMIAKYVERVGDHAANIAKMAVFSATGEDIRHPDAQGLSDGG
jgi:phosphate transport system protein